MFKISKWLFPQLLLLIILGWKSEIFLSFAFIIMHELSHYFVAEALNVKVKKFNIHPLGTTIELQSIDELSHKEELMIFSAGPLMNFILAFIFFIILRFTDIQLINTCVSINIALGVFNLIPAIPLDGAKILKSILSYRTLYKRAHNIVIYTSYSISILLLAIFLVNLLYKKVNIFILLISIMIFLESYKEKGRVMYVIMGDIIRKRKKFLKNKYIINRIISVYYKESLLNLLSYTTKNRYHIYYVLDDDMKMIGKITEQELVEALKNYGNILLEEYVELRNKNKLV